MRAAFGPAGRLVHAGALGSRSGVQEALHETGNELAAIEPAAGAAEGALGQRDVAVGRLDGAEFLQRRNQRAAQGDRHLERRAERPLLAVMVAADLAASLEQRGIAGV